MDYKNFKREHDLIIDEILALKGNNCTPIPDGVVDIKKYLESDTKILWINKEVNSEDDSDNWSLIDVLNDLRTKIEEKSGWGNTFLPIIYTVYGIFNKTKFSERPDIKSNPEMADIIKNIAYVNVKKLPGGKIANANEVRKYGEENDILKKQIKLFKPDVIICGGTFGTMLDELFADLYGETYRHMKNIPHTIENRIFYNGDLIIFEAYHPGQRKLTNQVYCDSISQNVLKWNKEFRKKRI